jgi:3-oxoadipyl-CoA thiolase
MAMNEAFVCDAVRTPFGRYSGSLSSIRTDDLAAIPIKALMTRNSQVDWSKVDDVIMGCANQAGEDNRNVGRMALLLAGLPETVPGCTINRLCGSSLDAIALANRAIKSGETELVVVAGVEGMSRAPFVMGKAETAYSRTMKIEDTTMGWRFINPGIKASYGIDTMPETAENVASEFNISRVDQDRFALRSQLLAAQAQQAGRLAEEIIAVDIPQKKGGTVQFASDEHIRADTDLEALSRLKPIVSAGGTVTAGNASGINDGAGAMLIASRAAAEYFALKPRVRIVASAIAGIAPRIMGFAPAPAIRKVLERCSLSLSQMDVIELNEAFAAQVLAVTRNLGLVDDDSRLNPNGGAIAIGHPLGASGVRLATTALHELERRQGRYALCSMCIGVGQGIAIVMERV